MGLASGIKVGRSHKEIVAPITRPFARQQSIAIRIECMDKSDFPPEIDGLNRK
jgi:hypothetical protein